MSVQVFLRGGLGNQLFQYSAGLYFARKQENRLTIRTDLLPTKEDSIGGVSRWPIQITDFQSEGECTSLRSQPPNTTNLYSKFRQLQRQIGDYFPLILQRLGILASEEREFPELRPRGRIRTVNSYCTSIVPAQRLGEDLRKQIRSVVDPSPEFNFLSQEIAEVRPIVLHIRMGDYLRLQHIYGTQNFRMIEKTTSQIRKSESSPIWVFTDSPDNLEERFLENLRPQRVIGPKDLPKPLENLVLMSLGSAFIASNSTFSWWSAYLMGDQGNVYYPTSRNFNHTAFSDNMRLQSWKEFNVD